MKRYSVGESLPRQSKRQHSHHQQCNHHHTRQQQHPAAGGCGAQHIYARILGGTPLRPAAIGAEREKFIREVEPASEYLVAYLLAFKDRVTMHAAQEQVFVPIARFTRGADDVLVCLRCPAMMAAMAIVFSAR